VLVTAPPLMRSGPTWAGGRRRRACRLVGSQALGQGARPCLVRVDQEQVPCCARAWFHRWLPTPRSPRRCSI